MAAKKSKKSKKSNPGEIVIAYSNELNDFPLSKYSVKQYDLFWAIVGKMRDQGTNTVVIPVFELKRMIGFQNSNERFNTLVGKLTKALLQTILRKDKENGSGWVMRTLFDKAEFDTNKGTLTLVVKDESAKFFNNLTGNFTMWYQRTLFDLDTVYAKSVFRKLSQFSKTGRYIAKIDDFRFVIGVPKSYPNREVKRMVIQPSLLRLAPYFRNLNCTYKTGKYNRLEAVEFTFDKFDSLDALEKDFDKFQCLSNIRLNPYMTDDEKCDAEDIFLKQKRGTAKDAMQARENAGLGPLDDIVDPADRDGTGKKVEEEKASEASTSDSGTSLDIKSTKTSSGGSARKMTDEINKALLKNVVDYESNTLPQDITINGNVKSSVSMGDPYVRDWLVDNFEIDLSNDLETRINALDMLRLSKDKKQTILCDLVFGDDWKHANEKIVPYDPILREIWGDLNARDAILLADVYKKWQFTGPRLSYEQKQDESLLRGLAIALSESTEILRKQYDANMLDALAQIKSWDKLRGWNQNYLLSEMPLNFATLTLNSLGIKPADWLEGKPNLEF